MLIRQKLQANAFFTILCHILGWALLAASAAHVTRLFDIQDSHLHLLALVYAAETTATDILAAGTADSRSAERRRELLLQATSMGASGNSAAVALAATIRKHAASSAPLTKQAALIQTEARRAAKEIHATATSSAHDLRQFSNTLILGLGVALVAITIVIATFTVLLLRSITRPLRVIREGTEIIGGGRLDHRIVLPEGDELSQLAASFNRMTARLALSTASRDELAIEVERRQKIEDALRETMARLEASNQELEQFAYAASHDLQEPLRSISGYLSILEGKFGASLGAEAEKYIARPIAAAKRLQDLIRGLLLYSRVGTKGKAFVKTDCQQLLESLKENLHAMIQESGAVITQNPTPLPVITADPGQILQLFQNLIQNAIKFRGQDPPRIHIEATEENKAWCFSVKDNGIGFDIQHADRIFLLYQRLHSRREFEGTGIGLAVCKKIVERHNGHIRVESEPGRGSTFSFTIKT